jgi:hypothetical protein
MKCFLLHSCYCALILLFSGCGGVSSPQPAQVDAVVPAETGNRAAAGSLAIAEPKEPQPAEQNPETAAAKEANETATASGDGTSSKSQPDESKSAKTTKGKTSSPKKETATNRPAPKPGVVHSITFDDLNCGMQADIVFRPWMLTDRVKELDGQRISIAGYMHPDAKQKGITEFILLRNTECKFGPAGQADHLIQVKLKPGITTRFSISPVEVVGILKFNPFTGPDGNTWSIFDMEGESVGPPKRPVPATSK